MGEPVAEDYGPARRRYRLIAHDVAMSENEIIYVGVATVHALREIDEAVVVGAERDFLFRHAAVRRPTVGKWYGPARVDSGVKFLQDSVAEHCPDEAEAEGKVAYAVAMRDIEAFAEDFGREGAVDDGDADFVAEVIEEPDVMVAYKPSYFNAAVGHAGELSEEAHISARHYGFVFKPVVKDVAYEIEASGVGGY